MNENDIRALLDKFRAILSRADRPATILDPENAICEVRAQTTAEPAQVRIMGVMDSFFGVDVREIISELDRQQPSAIHVLIESPGGRFSDGQAIYSDLAARRRGGTTITTEARGVVASAAVLPFMAGTDRAVPKGTQVMVHEPWMFVLGIGTSSEIKAQIDEQITALNSATKAYREMLTDAGISATAATAMTTGEHWYTPAEAVAAKLATREIKTAATDPDPQATAATLDRAKAILRKNLL